MKSRPEADSSPKNNLISITALEWIFLWDLHKTGLNLRIPFSYHCRISMFNFYYFVVQGRCFKVLWTIRANLLSQVLYKIRNKLVIWYRILGQSPYLEGESPKSRGEPTFWQKKWAVLLKSQNNPFKSYNRNYLLGLRHQPLLKFRHARLRDNNLLGQLNGQIERKTTAKPYGNILHGTACYDELPICAEELILR